jgi:hypothetical protein
VPHSPGLKKADLLIKDFQLQGVRDVIVDVTCRHEFRGSCANQQRNGEPSHLDVNGALDAAVKEKLDHYQHDYNVRNFFFLPSRRPPGESAETFSVCFTFCLTAKQQTTSHAWVSSIHPLRHSNNAEARTSIAPPSASRAPRPPQ